MRDLMTIIDGIQAVRQARRQFLRLWRLERAPLCLASGSSGWERLAADIARAGDAPGDRAGMDRASTKEGTILKTRSTWLFPRGRLADEWE